MAFPSSWCRVVVRSGQPHQTQNFNILWYILTGTSEEEPQPTATALANACSAQIQDAWKACMTTECTYYGITLEMHDEGVVWTVADISDAGPGTVVGDTMPAYGAVIIQRRTATPGATGRGRIFVPGVPESATDDSFLTTGGPWDTLAEELATTITAVGITMTPAHYSRPTEVLLPTISWSKVVALSTMRSRRISGLL